MAAEPESAFGQSENLRLSVGLINALPADKFPRLLQRVVTKLHLPNERAFTAEEEEALQETLGLDGSQVTLILETIAFIFETAAYSQMSPAVISKHLGLAGVTEDQSAIIAKCWTSFGPDLIQKLRDRSFYSRELKEVNWRLNLQLAQASRARTIIPNAQFELVVGGADTTERVQLELTHAELFKLYTQLELVQSQLDQLA